MLSEEEFQKLTPKEQKDIIVNIITNELSRRNSSSYAIQHLHQGIELDKLYHQLYCIVQYKNKATMLNIELDFSIPFINDNNEAEFVMSVIKCNNTDIAISIPKKLYFIHINFSEIMEFLYNNESIIFDTHNLKDEFIQGADEEIVWRQVALYSDIITESRIKFSKNTVIKFEKIIYYDFIDKIEKEKNKGDTWTETTYSFIRSIVKILKLILAFTQNYIDIIDEYNPKILKTVDSIKKLIDELSEYEHEFGDMDFRIQIKYLEQCKKLVGNILKAEGVKI
jgi:hypothetical protein